MPTDRELIAHAAGLLDAEVEEMREGIDLLCADLPLRQLAGTAVLREEADRLARDAVPRARLIGYSWQEIADALGVTRQTAHARYRALCDE